jgi:hypothetical protein
VTDISRAYPLATVGRIRAHPGADGRTASWERAVARRGSGCHDGDAMRTFRAFAFYGGRCPA